MCELSRFILLGILADKSKMSKWVEHIKCLRVQEDLPDYRETFDVPRELSIREARAYILADLMQSYYCERIPAVGTPYREIIASGLNEADWIAIASEFIERTKGC